MPNFKKLKRPMAATAALLTLGLSGCVKQRPDQFADGTVDFPSQVSDVQNAQMSIHTASEPEKVSGAAALRAENQGTLVAVDGYKGPDQYSAMFKDLVIHGEPNTTYEVHFAIDQSFVTAYMEMDPRDEDALSPIQRELAKQFGKLFAASAMQSGKQIMRISAADVGAGDVLRVPLFQYAVKDYGQVDHAQNVLNEQTNTLRLDHSDWSSSAYVIFSTREIDRLPYQLAPGDADAGTSGSEPNRIFSKSQIDQKVFSTQQLRGEMQLSVSDQNPNSQYFTRIDDKQMSLYKVLSQPSNDMLPQQLRAIRENDSGMMKEAGVLPCTDGARKAISAGASGGCFMVLEYTMKDVVPVQVAAQMSLNLTSESSLSSTISFVDSPNKNSDMIRLKQSLAPKKLWQLDASDLLDPAQTLSVDKMKDKEFLMTRTLTDSPSSFGELFLGNAGKLEIIRFEFLQDRVRIVRSKPRVEHLGSNNEDLDALMSFPASYRVLTTVDDDGTQLATPRVKKANYNTPGAIAVIDWTKNELPELNSPLDYYEIDQCFASENEKEVSDVDNEPDQGLLGFTYTRTYQGSRNVDCAGIYFQNSDYFAPYAQTNFRFSERISFRQYNSADDKNVILDMPYEVQQQLGFGLFTNPVVNPDGYGDTDRQHSMQNLAMLWDLKNGKKITYVLAGLPPANAPESQLEGGVTRQDIIDATRSVFKDLDKAMHEALKGSPLERPDSESILELKVEGDDAPVGHLGDIQRNTIYWVQKQLDSPIWGLAQAQPNPRSGMIETSNVYVYGGNFLSTVPMLKERATWEKYYADKTANAVATVKANQANAAAAQVGVPNGGAAPPPVTKPQKQVAAYFDALANGATPDFAEYISEHPEELRFHSEVDDKTALLQSSALQSIAMDQADAKAIALQKIIEQVRLKPEMKDPNEIEALVDQNLYDISGGTISDQTVSRLKAMSGRAALRGRVMKQLRSMGICLYDRSELSGLATLGEDEDTLKWTDKQWVLNIYKPTLAHEVGHTLGLRHNFQGSYDRANWYFATDDRHKRAYSSIMDYMVDDHVTYDGMGPYDVAALRAAYTGRVELADGSLASFDEVKKAAGVANWFDFKGVDPKTLKINGQPLRHFDFCSDEDLDGDPTCRQFDHGTTPLEIVNYDIDEYRALYPIHNFPLDKQVFSERETGGYIAFLIDKMIPIRKFLEETFYQIAHGADQKTANLYLAAVDRASGFFNEIIRNPDAPSWAYGNDHRFTPPLYNGDGDIVLLERKPVIDVPVPNSNSDELLVRGTEFDKIVALEMLTERTFGFPRYLRDHILISYPEYERMRAGGNPLAGATVALLNEMLTGVITPMAWTTHGLQKMPSEYETSVTDSMRYFASMAAIVNLNANVMSEDLDPSSLFRVLATSSLPKGVDGAYMPSSFGNEGELVYWAPAGAPETNEMLGLADGISKVLALRPKLEPLLKQWIQLKIAPQYSNVNFNLGMQAMAESGNLSLDEVSGQINSLLATLPVSSGCVTDKNGKSHPLTTFELEDQAKKLMKCYLPFHDQSVKARQTNSSDDRIRAEELQESCRNQLMHASIEVPLMGLLISEFSAGDMSMVRPDPSLLLNTEGTIVSNSKVLNELLVAIHPEVNREYQ